MRLIDSGRKLLALEETARLHGAHGSVFSLGHIEDDRMGMKLWRCVSVHRARGVMLEGCGHKLPCRLGSMVAADAGLGIMLQLIQGKCDRFAMGFSHRIITTDESCQRNRF